MQYPLPMNKPARTPKQDAAAMIAALPEDASMAEIFYRLYVLEHIREGLADIEAGRTVPHEEVVADLRKWLGE
jgi:predicted transcriptional regulator